MRQYPSPTQILLSFSTVPLLLVVVGGKALASLMQDLGQTSEELFRGDRLPVLKIPHRMPEVDDLDSDGLDKSLNATPDNDALDHSH